MSASRHPLRRIFLYWIPMFGAWLMMAAEAPFIAAVIARMPEPKVNLAAFGVAYAVAILVESPVIMMMSASTALVRGRGSLARLRRFSTALNVAVTTVMLVLVWTPAWDILGSRVIGLPGQVVELTRIGLLILTPWPAAIGYRRFYQGLLVRSGKTRRVAYGTVTRLVSMATTGLALLLFCDLPGAWVGPGALSVGVLVEALASRVMARSELIRLRHAPGKTAPPTYRRIISFYWPLALTSLIGLAVHPLITFFMGKGRFPLASLAVLPVVNSFTFMFRAIGLSFQEVAIALLGRSRQDEPYVLRFAGHLAAWGTGVMTLVAFTPLLSVWLQGVSGLSDELADFARLPIRILCVIPAMSVLLSMQRAVLVHGHLTRPITTATTLEIATTAIALFVLIGRLDLVGATAAAIAIVAGRAVGNLVLIDPCRRVLSDSG
jgi:hypothetical protein